MRTPDRYREDYDPDQHPRDDDRPPREGSQRPWNGDPQTQPDFDDDAFSEPDPRDEEDTSREAALRESDWWNG